MLINDRVRLIIKANSLSSSEFADQIGVKRSNLSHVLSGRNKPGTEFLAKIIDAFPNVNASWLLTGVQRTGEFQEEIESKDLLSTKVVSNISSSTSSSKEIDKIIVFYSDGTFTSHAPSEQ